jgi:hypothetical protein
LESLRGMLVLFTLQTEFCEAIYYLMYSAPWCSRVCLAYLSFVNECLPLYRIEFVYNYHSFSMTVYFFKLLYLLDILHAWRRNEEIGFPFTYLSIEPFIPYLYSPDQWKQGNNLYSNNLFEFRGMRKWMFGTRFPTIRIVFHAVADYF